LTVPPELLKTGQVVQDELKQIGVTMTIKPVDVSFWFDAFSTSKYQITSAYQERTIDPDNFYALVIVGRSDERHRLFQSCGRRTHRQGGGE
jgi:ABC-type transport system substrate-binding protein